MRVWLVQTTGEPLPLFPDGRLLRTGRHAKDLAAAGHDVLWWATTFDHDAKRQVAPPGRRLAAPGLALHLLPSREYRRNVSLRRYLADMAVARSFNDEIGRLSPPDLIVASMPSYFVASEAVAYGRRHNVPVVVDVRDAWPDTFVDALPLWTRPFSRLALARDRQLVRSLLRDANAITAMMDDLLEWALKKAGRPRGESDRVFHLGAPEQQPADPKRTSPRVRDLAEEVRGRFVVTYVGAFGHYTDPEVIISAARILNNSQAGHARFAFVLAGTGPSADDVRRSSSDVANAHFTGQLEGNDLATILSVASVGVVACPRGYDAMPNKFFTYLAAGLPVLGSPSGEMKGILTGQDIGLPFRAEDPASLADAILRLERQPSEREHMARRARALFQERFESTRLNSQFVRYLEELVSRQHVGATILAQANSF